MYLSLCFLVKSHLHCCTQAIFEAASLAPKSRTSIRCDEVGSFCRLIVLKLASAIIRSTELAAAQRTLLFCSFTSKHATTKAQGFIHPRVNVYNQK